jgi:hypothetical protein
MSKNLFNEEQSEEIVERAKGIYQSWKRKHLYHKSEHKGVSCSFCEHLRKKEGHSCNYYKCELLGGSDSIASDIRLFCVCDMFLLRKGE